MFRNKILSGFVSEMINKRVLISTPVAVFLFIAIII